MSNILEVSSIRLSPDDPIITALGAPACDQAERFFFGALRDHVIRTRTALVYVLRTNETLEIFQVQQLLVKPSEYGVRSEIIQDPSPLQGMIAVKILVDNADCEDPRFLLARPIILTHPYQEALRAKLRKMGIVPNLWPSSELLNFDQRKWNKTYRDLQRPVELEEK